MCKGAGKRILNHEGRTRTGSGHFNQYFSNMLWDNTFFFVGKNETYIHKHQPKTVNNKQKNKYLYNNNGQNYRAAIFL